MFRETNWQVFKAIAVQQSAIDRASRRLAKAGELLDEALGLAASAIADPAAISAEVLALKNELKVKQKALFGNPLQSERYIEQVPAPATRLSNIAFGAFGSTHGPTGTHKQQLAIVEKELAKLLPEVDQLIDQKVAAIKTKMKQLGLVLTNDPN